MGSGGNTCRNLDDICIVVEYASPHRLTGYAKINKKRREKSIANECKMGCGDRRGQGIFINVTLLV
jgi:hypothetical protein